MTRLTISGIALLLATLTAQTPNSAPARIAPPPDTGQKATKELPLEPGRKARFTTSKGSWISLDVSPDGQTILFDLLGDLYTLPMAGGQARPLLTGMASESQPRFSPDGKRIVFVSDRSGGENVWTMALDLKDTTQITKGNDNIYASPEWTPDGRYVVASKARPPFGDAAKIWIYHVQGGSGVQLGKPGPTDKQIGAAFGPDGRRMWYAQRRGDWDYNAQLPQYSLQSYDRETGKSTMVASRWGSAFRPAVSPDGKWLPHGSRHNLQTGLRIRDLITGEDRWLAYPIQHDEQEGRATSDVLPGYPFTPDSRALIMSYGGEIWRVPVDGSAATKIPFTADVDLDLGPEVRFSYRIEDTPTFTARQMRNPVASPDGRRMAFTVLDRLYVMDYPSGTPRRLTNENVGEFGPSWSPDGRSIAFATWSESGAGHLMKGSADEG